MSNFQSDFWQAKESNPNWTIAREEDCVVLQVPAKCNSRWAVVWLLISSLFAVGPILVGSLMGGLLFYQGITSQEILLVASGSVMLLSVTFIFLCLSYVYAWMFWGREIVKIEEFQIHIGWRSLCYSRSKSYHLPKVRRLRVQTQSTAWHVYGYSKEYWSPWTWLCFTYDEQLIGFGISLGQSEAEKALAALVQHCPQLEN